MSDRILGAYNIFDLRAAASEVGALSPALRPAGA
mgnify:CR=1 FL=1